MVVRRIGLEEALDLYELRGVLLGFACETLARRRSAGQLAELEKALEGMAEALVADDVDLYYRRNIDFHAMIAAFCGNRRAHLAYEGVVKEMHLFRRRGLSRTGSLGASFAEHRAIVDAIIARDPDAAFRSGRQHVRNGRERFLGSLDEAPEEAREGARG